MYADPYNAESSAPFIAPQDVSDYSQHPYQTQPAAQGVVATQAGQPGVSAGGKFTADTWRDIPWAILFLVHLFGYIGGGVYFVVKYASEMTVEHYDQNTQLSIVYYPYDPVTGQSYTYHNQNMLTDNTTDNNIRLQVDVVYLSLSTLGISVLVAVLWLVLVKSYARGMIYIALWSDVVISGLAVVVCVIYNEWVGVIVFGIWMALKVLFIYWMRDRIEFAARILYYASGTIQQWPATIAAGVTGIFLQTGWYVAWSISSVGYYYVASRTSTTTVDNQTGEVQQNNSLSYVVMFLTLVSFYWTSQVVKNVVHVTVAGVAATWYFLFPVTVVKNPTWNSFKRATTTSFGSICLGSLIIAVIRALRVMVQFLAQQGGQPRNPVAAALRAISYCIAQCILACLDRIVEYVNQYAFAQVAIYGVSYCEAAQRTWDLFKSRGFDAFLNDTLIGIALGFAALMGGICSALAAGFLSGVVFTNSGPLIIWAVIGFVFGFAMTLIATEVIESAVVALFVCLCEDPSALQRTKPEVYNTLVPMITNRYPSIRF